MEDEEELEDEVIESYLTFRVGERMYGIHVRNVVEILQWSEAITKQDGPPYLLGLYHFREEVLPFIDCGLKFGQGATEVGEATYILVMRMHPGEAEKQFDVAVAVDEVTGVIDLPEEQRKKIDSRYKPGYVRFGAMVGDRLALIFEPDLVFTDTEVVEMAQIAAK